MTSLWGGDRIINPNEKYSSDKVPLPKTSKTGPNLWGGDTYRPGEAPKGNADLSIGDLDPRAADVEPRVEAKKQNPFLAAVKLVAEYPNLEVVMPAHGLSENPELYATYNNEMSFPKEDGSRSKIYKIWDGNEIVRVTTNPEKWTNDIRDLS